MEGLMVMCFSVAIVPVSIIVYGVVGATYLTIKEKIQ